MIKMNIFEPEKIGMERYVTVAKSLSDYLLTGISCVLPPNKTTELLDYVNQTKVILSKVKDAKELLSFTNQPLEIVNFLETEFNACLEKVGTNLPELMIAEKKSILADYKQKRKAETLATFSGNSYSDPLVIHKGLQMFEQSELAAAKESFKTYIFDNSYLKKLVEKSVDAKNMHIAQEAFFLLADYVKTFGYDQSSENFVVWYVSSLEENLRKAGSPRIMQELLDTAPKLGSLEGIMAHAKVFGKLPGMPVSYETEDIPLSQLQAVDSTAISIGKELQTRIKQREPDKSVLFKKLDYATCGDTLEQSLLDWFELRSQEGGPNSAKFKLAGIIYRITHANTAAAEAVVTDLQENMSKEGESKIKLPDITDDAEIGTFFDTLYKGLKPIKKEISSLKTIEQLVNDGVLIIQPQVGEGNPIKIIREAHAPECLKLEGMLIETACNEAASNGKRVMVITEQPIEAAMQGIYGQCAVSQGLISNVDEYIELSMLMGLHIFDITEKSAELGAISFPMESEEARMKFMYGLKLVNVKMGQIAEAMNHLRAGTVIDLLGEPELQIISEITGIDIDHYRNLLSPEHSIGKQGVSRAAEKLMLQFHILDAVPHDANCNRERVMGTVVEKVSPFADDVWVVVGSNHGREDSRLLRTLKENGLAYQIVDIDISKLPLDINRAAVRYHRFFERATQ